MFQYVWFDKKKFTPRDIPALPEDFINYSDIEKIAAVYWEEHCTECAMPLCYNNCANWEARTDKKCRKFVYGIKKTKAKKSYNATVALKKWGKIESVFYNRILTPSKAKFLDGTNHWFSNVVKFFSKMLRFASPTLKPSGFVEFLKQKMYAKIGKKGCLPSFLVSCYLHDEVPCSLFFEIFNVGSVPVRQVIRLQPGFNQILLDLGNYAAQITDETRVRIFGSEETTCEATFFFLDFVELKDSGKLKLLPKTDRPADKVKCVVWDLDNTIWDGILIESDPEALQLRPNVLQTIKWLDERGIIQCVCSKNDAPNAESVLKRLGIDDYFVYKSINWVPKSLNIHELAKQININVNTFAFVDDSPSERNEVGKNLPSVRVFKETEITEFAKHPAFDVPITEDSKNRRKMYQINKSRNDYQSKMNLNPLDFLRQCELTAEISHIRTEEQKRRSYELLLRTNQLNLSGEKYEEAAFELLLERNHENIFILSLEDKFGTYGQSMFLCVQPHADRIDINEFALSCRIAGKYVESALMQWLTTKYADLDIVLSGKNNKKNMLLIQTLKGIGFEQLTKEEDSDLVLRHKKATPFDGCDIVHIRDNTEK